MFAGGDRRDTVVATLVKFVDEIGNGTALRRRRLRGKHDTSKKESKIRALVKKMMTANVAKMMVLMGRFGSLILNNRKCTVVRCST